MSRLMISNGTHLNSNSIDDIKGYDTTVGYSKHANKPSEIDAEVC